MAGMYGYKRIIIPEENGGLLISCQCSFGIKDLHRIQIKPGGWIFTVCRWVNWLALAGAVQYKGRIRPQ